MDFEAVVREVGKKYEELDAIRESVLNLSRKIVRSCAQSVKLAHRGEWEKVDAILATVAGQVSRLKESVAPLLEVGVANYAITPEQEFCEVVLLSKILRELPLPRPGDLGVSPLAYLTGAADVVGELRRYCLDSVRNGSIDEGVRAFEKMEEILDALFTLDFPSGLIPGLRKKVDMARRVVNATRSDVTFAVQARRVSLSLSPSDGGDRNGRS